MLAVWIVVGAVVVVALGVAAFFDRRARARGSRTRASGDIAAAERDMRRSIRGSRFGAAPRMDTWRTPNDKG